MSDTHPPLAATDALRALAAQMMSAELIVFPVRHHSPACALHLRQLLQSLTPSAILVEGPRGFTPLIPLLAHAEARMPLAVYTYAVQRTEDDAAPPRRAAYYPFCDHSPELVALRAAHVSNIPASFIDLDFAEQSLLEPGHGDEEAGSLLDESRFRRSRHLSLLAEQLGCRDHEELWEHLFEAPSGGRSLQAHIENMVAYCQLARSECGEEELRAHGTLQREAEMAWHIRQALNARKPNEGPVLAVLGGFHAVAMPALLAGAAARPRIDRSGVTDEFSALIRYSFDRLDRLNGYAAGMTSPAWHQMLWERIAGQEMDSNEAQLRARRETALAVLFDIAAELRERHDLALPLPALTAAYEHALRLAALRGRSAPVRDDVLDAVTSCFVKGEADAEGLLVLAAAHRMLGGTAMGRLPPGAGTPPLVRDAEYRARRQRLKIDDAAPRRLVLDLYRRPEHRITSRLLHGLTLLGIPFAVRSGGPDFVNGSGLDRLQEHWEYNWSAATEAALVEASVNGVTVPLAVATRFASRLQMLEAGAEQHDARRAAALLTHACVLGLHDHLPRVMDLLRREINGDPSFASVVDAAGSIGLLWESREPLEARDAADIPPLLNSAYERAVFLGRSPAGDDNETMHALSRLRELLVSAAGGALDAALYWQMVAALQAEHEAPSVRGAAAGLLYASGRMTGQVLEAVLRGHLNGSIAAAEAASFLRGLLHSAREAAWQQPALLGVLDLLLREWDEDTFIANLPELRLAFAAMTPKETDRIAEAVAQMHGASALFVPVRHDLSAAELQANFALSRTLETLLSRDGLHGWLAT